MFFLPSQVIELLFVIQPSTLGHDVLVDEPSRVIEPSLVFKPHLLLNPHFFLTLICCRILTYQIKPSLVVQPSTFVQSLLVFEPKFNFEPPLRLQRDLEGHESSKIQYSRHFWATFGS